MSCSPSARLQTTQLEAARANDDSVMPVHVSAPTASISIKLPQHLPDGFVVERFYADSGANRNLHPDIIEGEELPAIMLAKTWNPHGVRPWRMHPL